MGMMAQVLGMTNKDSQFIEPRGMTRGDIASIFGIPPHKIGDRARDLLQHRATGGTMFSGLRYSSPNCMEIKRGARRSNCTANARV